MTSKPRSIARSSSALADAWEKRTLLVKQEQAAASAANDAKTARLKALRMERELQEEAIAGDKPKKPPRAPAIKRVTVK